MGRSYRIRKRGLSMPGGGEARDGDRERRRSSQQDALGGWWKMRWWREGRDEDGKGKGKRKGGDSDRDAGGNENGLRESV